MTTPAPTTPPDAPALRTESHVHTINGMFTGLRGVDDVTLEKILEMLAKRQAEEKTK